MSPAYAILLLFVLALIVILACDGDDDRWKYS